MIVKCQTCGKEFKIKPSQLLRDRGKYCSRICMNSNLEYRKRKSETLKGHIVSEETRKKMSIALSGEKSCWFGRHHSDKTKNKLSEANSGKKNGSWGKKGKLSPRWKGGITDKQKIIRNSFNYKEWRKSVFERDNYTCQKCGQVGKTLNAHHIESFDNNPDKRTLVENGITFCKECHRNFHHIFGCGNNNREQLIIFLKNKNDNK